MPYNAVLLIALLSAVPANAADYGRPAYVRQLEVDRLLQAEMTERSPAKSPAVAFVLSLAVPGLGEFYAGAPKRGAAFLAVEAFTWFNWSRWRRNGNDLKAEFRTYADLYWNEDRYRDWQAYNRSQGSPYNETETLPCKGNEPSLDDCEKVDTQQYYEMIGKYDQFVFGWADVSGVPVTVFNPDVTSDQRIDYENQRNESNKALKRASVVLGLSVLNHVVSAIHASAVARSNTQGPTASFSTIGSRGNWQPTVTVTKRF